MQNQGSNASADPVQIPVMRDVKDGEETSIPLRNAAIES